MLRAPRTLAPATAQPTKSSPALNPTEPLWPAGLSSPQLCPATATTSTTTYYTSLYTQTVPSAAALGTCLDATPHGPEGQIVRCVPAGRLPVMLGTPGTSHMRVWVGEKEGGRLGFSFEYSWLRWASGENPFVFLLHEITISPAVGECDEHWTGSLETQTNAQRASVTLTESTRHRHCYSSFIPSLFTPETSTCHSRPGAWPVGFPGDRRVGLWSSLVWTKWSSQLLLKCCPQALPTAWSSSEIASSRCKCS